MHKLKDNFTNKDLIAAISPEWLNTVARWLNGMWMVNGEVVRNRYGICLNQFAGPIGGASAGGGIFNWKVSGTALGITITPGEVELGPDTVIPWDSITDHTTAITLSAGTTEWFIWVNVDVTDGAESATMLNGSSITSLTSDEKKHIRQKKIAVIYLTDDIVSEIDQCQCGNIDIPRL